MRDGGQFALGGKEELALFLCLFLSLIDNQGQEDFVVCLGKTEGG